MCSSTNAGSTVASGAAAASAGAHAATAAAMRARLGACRPRRGACPFFAASLPRRRFTRAADIRRPARRPQRSARACRSQARRLRPTGLGAWLPGGAAAGRRAGARRAARLIRRDRRSRQRAQRPARRQEARLGAGRGHRRRQARVRRGDAQQVRAQRRAGARPGPDPSPGARRPARTGQQRVRQHQPGERGGAIDAGGERQVGEPGQWPVCARPRPPAQPREYVHHAGGCAPCWTGRV